MSSRVATPYGKDESCPGGITAAWLTFSRHMIAWCCTAEIEDHSMANKQGRINKDSVGVAEQIKDDSCTHLVDERH